MSQPPTACRITCRPLWLRRRLTMLAALTAAWCAAGLVAPVPWAAAATLGSPTWAATSTTVGAGSTYTFGFTSPVTTLLLTSMTMTVPAGTTGTPTLGTVVPAGLLGTGTITLTGTTLTYSGTLTTLLPGTAVSVQVKGLTNTTNSGTYTSALTTINGVTPTATGTTNSLTFTGSRNLTTPSSLGWSAALTGANQSLVDPTPADQQLTVNDATGTGAGWHLALAATTFTTGTQALANSGTFVFTSSQSVTSTTAPSTACVTTCTLPGNTVTYPVAVTTAASSPTPSTIWSAPAGTGLGAITIGGSTAARPVGWWVKVPGNTPAGTYTSTITVQMISGP